MFDFGLFAVRIVVRNFCGNCSVFRRFRCFYAVGFFGIRRLICGLAGAGGLKCRGVGGFGNKVHYFIIFAGIGLWCGRMKCSGD